MGLDVYVGALTRYYGGDWSLITQQIAAAAGMPTTVVHHDAAAVFAAGAEQPLASSAAAPEPANTSLWRRLRRWLGVLPSPGDAPSVTTDARSLIESMPTSEAVSAWRDALNQQLEHQLAVPLDWDESEAAPYFTDKPGWDGYACLLLLAAHDEYPELPRPTTATNDWADDPAWERASRQDFAHTRYASILTPSLWLPCEVEFRVPTQDLAGEDIEVGSSVALLAQLRALNERTFGGSPDELAQWLGAGPEPGTGVDLTASPEQIKQQLADRSDEPVPFDYTARFGLALFLDLAEKSVTHRLPMKLDW